MRPIDEILIENQISPTRLTPVQKEAFTRYLSLARSNTLDGFETFIQTTNRESVDMINSLSRAADLIFKTICTLSSSIDSQLRKDTVFFTDQRSRSAFTDRHVQLINEAQEQLNFLASAAVILQDIREAAERSVCSSEFISEVTLRHIALLNDAKDAPITAAYRKLTNNLTKLTDAINMHIQTLEERLTALEQDISDFIISSSRAITRVNKNEQPQAAYFNLLRAEQLQLHDQKELINRIKNEVQHVKISDVL